MASWLVMPAISLLIELALLDAGVNVALAAFASVTIAGIYFGIRKIKRLIK